MKFHFLARTFLNLFWLTLMSLFGKTGCIRTLVCGLWEAVKNEESSGQKSNKDEEKTEGNWRQEYEKAVWREPLTWNKTELA